MIQVTKQQNGNVVLVHLTGSIEETVNFVNLIGPPPAVLEVNCKGISRINSAGVKAWIVYFQACQANKTKIKFVECSMPIVEQMNLISNFHCGGTVESIYVPFFCKNCKRQLMSLFQVEELRQRSFEIPTLSCNNCSGPATFDDQIDEYLGCFQRT